MHPGQECWKRGEERANNHRTESFRVKAKTALIVAILPIIEASTRVFSINEFVMFPWLWWQGSRAKRPSRAVQPNTRASSRMTAPHCSC